jgi:hypothetical protein
MEHLSFEIICRIADGDINQNEMAVHLSHLNKCRTCQYEVELQKSILKVSQQTQLINPSSHFTKDVLDTLIPTKKKWYEWILHNMGNIIAMTSVLTFLGYIFLVTGNTPFQNDKPAKVEPILEYFKIIQNSSKQLGNFFAQKSHTQAIEVPHTNTVAFALLAIVLLVFIDQIAGYFFRRSKI